MSKTIGVMLGLLNLITSSFWVDQLDGYRENRYGTNRLASTVRFCRSVRIARNRIVPSRFYNIIGPVQYGTILRKSYQSAKSDSTVLALYIEGSI